MKSTSQRLLSFALGLTLITFQIPVFAAQYFPGTRILFNPGHYVAIHTDANLSTPYAASLMRAPIIGVHKPYTWKYLEKSKGVYDFSTIEKDLALMNSRGKKLIISLRDKTFSQGEVALPDYLINPRNAQYSAAYKGGHTRNYQGGYTPKKWIPGVNTRIQALYAALGARFNGRIEAVQVGETATSLRHLTPADFDNGTYVQGIIDNIRALKASFPNTVVQQRVNGLGNKPNGTSYMVDFINAVKASKIGISTQDIYLNDSWQWEHVFKYFLPYSKTRSAPVGAMVEDENYKANSPSSPAYLSPGKLANFGIGKLGVSYIYWGPRNAAIMQDVRNTVPRYKTVLQ